MIEGSEAYPYPYNKASRGIFSLKDRGQYAPKDFRRLPLFGGVIQFQSTIPYDR